MTQLTADGAAGAMRSQRSSDLYRAVWRWHFYAGLFVLPFLITLSITGALYLFRDEIDAIVHADLMRVEAREDTARAAPSAIIAAALAAHPGLAVRYVDPPRPDASAEIVISTIRGERLAVYVDPYDARVMGALDDRGTVMWTVRYLHSLRFFGPVARGLIEIAGGLAILLVITGVFLWWPRGQRGGVVSVRGTPAKRVFWRDAHAVLGLFAGGFILFLAVTGMPWSQVWGGQVNQWANGSNFGYPSGVRVDIPMSGERLAETGPTSWSMGEAQIPASPPSGPAAQPIGVDAAVRAFQRIGLHSGFAVALPSTATGVYSGSVYPDDAAQQRVVHLDQYTGEPLIDMGYADYGPMGRALEWGISVHMGQQFGLANQIVLLLVCLCGVLLSVSAGVMWWKRRPQRSFGVPPAPQDPRIMRGLVILLLLGGILFPLAGLAIATMLLIDRAVAFFVASRRRARA